MSTKLQAIEITKRNKTRTLYVPTPGDAYAWRNYDISAKRFVFEKERTVYKRGQLTIIFDLAGRPIEAWSYWTCIMCYSEPCEDWPQGRLIFNDSGYGSYTGKHINQAMWFFFSGEMIKRKRRVYRRVEKVVGSWVMREYTSASGEHVPARIVPTTRATQAYTREDVIEVSDSSWYYKADQICWGRGATADDMRAEYKTMARHRPWAVIRAERQAAYDAQVAAYRAEQELHEVSDAQVS